MYYILHDVVVKDLRSHLLKGNCRADNGVSSEIVSVYLRRDRASRSFS